MEWYLMALQKFADFSGRSRRKEYWMFVLINFLISAGLSLFQGMTSGSSFLSGLYGLIMLLPSLAVTVRRLHDTGRSGWWVLIGLIPIIGWIWLLVYMAEEGHSGSNEYGANPK